MGDQEGTNGHGDPADQAKHEHRRREQRQAMAGHQPDHRQHHQNKAEAQLGFQRHNFHQPGIEENRDQDPCVQEGKSVTHAGNGQIKVIGDISHHHPGDDYQRTGKGVGEEADPCELGTIAVSHDWPVNSCVKRVDSALSEQILVIDVMHS